MKELTWLQFVGKMKKQFPASRKVVVETTSGLPLDKSIDPPCRYDGETIQYETHYKVLINKDLSLDQKKETLMHEWAHILAWNLDEDNEHSGIWGAVHAWVYRTVLGWRC